MKKFLLLFLFFVVLLLFGCTKIGQGQLNQGKQTPEEPTVGSTTNIRIEFKETGGIANFIKTLEVDNDGSMKLTTALNYRVLSIRTGKIERGNLERLIKEIIELGFFEFTQEEIDKMEMPAADMPQKELKITLDNLTKTLHWTNTTHKIKVVEEKFEALKARTTNELELVPNDMSSESIWLSIEPIQCQANAWEKWLAESGIRFVKQPTEKELLTLYFKNALDIELLDYYSVRKYEIVCMACNCPRGDEVFVKVYKKDMQKLLDLGWKIADKQTKAG